MQCGIPACSRDIGIPFQVKAAIKKRARVERVLNGLATARSQSRHMFDKSSEQRCKDAHLDPGIEFAGLSAIGGMLP
jgi:CO dehydrogenase/acetyl-CoA synthase alpha subunit